MQSKPKTRLPQSAFSDASGRSSLLNELDERLQRLSDRERFRQNPADFAYEIIGRDVLARAAGREIEFTEKQLAFLRDAVNPQIDSIIVKTGRGCSKTFLLALMIACCCYLDTRFTCTVLAGSFEQARYLYHYFSIFAQSERFRKCISNAGVQRTKTELTAGGWLLILTASEKQIKGLHPAMLVIDEACAADSKILELAMGQLIGSRSDKPLLRIASTPDKLDHLFRKYWNKADEYGFVRHSWRALDCPWIPVAEIEKWRKRQDKNWCRIHIDGEFGSATGTVFDFDDVEAAKSETLEEFAAKSELDFEIEKTSIGVDWGFVHPTVFTVVSRVVFRARQTIESGLVGRSPVAARSPPTLRLYFVRHNEEHVGVPEARLYERVYAIAKDYGANVALLDSSHKFQNEVVERQLGSLGCDVREIAFVKDKMPMISLSNALLEHREIRIPEKFEKLREQLANYSWEENREKPRKLDDDHVDSFILGVWAFAEGDYGAVEVDDNLFR